jgi:hypothetical protein
MYASEDLSPSRPSTGFSYSATLSALLQHPGAHHFLPSRLPLQAPVLGLYHSISPIPLRPLLPFLPPLLYPGLPFPIDHSHRPLAFPDVYSQIVGLWKFAVRPQRMSAVLEIWLLISSLPLRVDSTYLAILPSLRAMYPPQQLSLPSP